MDVLAAGAVILGDVLVSAAWVLLAAVAALGGSNPEVDPIAVILAIFALPIIGLVFLGLPAFVLAFDVFWPWSFVVRWLGRGRPGQATMVTPDHLVAGRPQ